MRKQTAVLIHLALLVVLLAGCAAPAAPTAAPQQPEATQAPAQPEAPTEQIKLTIWWWGEQEAPGAEKWLNETIAEYQAAHPNIQIESVLQSTDTLIPAFQAAAQAKEGPDIQYFWGGVWTLENVWAGSLLPLDDLIPAEERSHYINNFERSFDGKQYGIGWYLSGNPFVFNPKLFEQAGLSTTDLPDTWDELKDACTALKGAGIIPIAGGLKDGWFGGWLFSILARQPHDSEAAFKAASVGQSKFTDPEFAEWWSRVKELIDAGCWNEDINSLDYQQGQDLFVQGKAAMIFGNDTFLKGWADVIGWDSIGVMPVPKYASGKLADTYVTTAQGWGIPVWTKYPQEAADFLMFTHTPERLAKWYEYTGVLPADDRMNPDVITVPQIKQIFEWASERPGPNLENFIPSMLDEQANFAGVQLLFAGESTPEELAQLSEDVIVKWREQNPDAVENFTNWLK